MLNKKTVSVVFLLILLVGLLSSSLFAASKLIEAENYIYMSGIKVENCGEGGQNVGYIDSGDWMTYDINVETAGDYLVEYRVASQNSAGIINLEQNAGRTVLGSVNVPNTGGWQNWQTISHTVSLKAGQQQFGIGVPAGGYNINWIKFSKVSGDNDSDGVGPVGYYGEMQVKGNRIYGSKTNAEMQVKGMSFFWSNWSAQHWNRAMVDKMVDEFKVEIVRASYGVDNGGNPYGGSNEDQVDAVVNAAINRGIYVIIDWHSHGAQYNVGAAQDFFGRMAQKYGQYDNVIFEIFNEPLQVPWTEVKSYAEQVIPIIRQYSDNLIVVGTPSWSQDVDQAANNPVNADNIAYTLHFYAGTHFQYLRDKANYAINKGLALFVTEWGTVNANGDGRVNYSSTEEWLKWMDQNKISWCNWSINDKAEGASIFNPDGTLSESGKYLKSILEGAAPYAPWRN